MKKLFIPSLFSYSFFLLVFLAPVALYAQKDETHTRCSGSSITLQATEKTGATYKWFANNVEIPNETESTLTVSPPSTTTYHAKVTTAGNSSTASLIPNGGFESGNILGETNDLGQQIKYEYNNMQGIDKAIGINESAIVKNAKIGNPTWFVDLEPKTGDRMLVCDGGDNPNTRIWSARDLALVGGKTYEFSCYVANIHKNSLNPAGLQFIIETPAGTQTLLSFTAPTSNGKWEFHKITYTPPADASWAHIWINNNETAPDGNDFAIDDIYFGLEQTTGPVITTDTFTVNVDTPATVLIEDMNVCQNAGFTLPATVSGGTNNVISWTKNENTLTGSTAAYISNTAPATVGESDTYAISVKSGVCTAVTQSATVTALSCSSTQDATMCLGDSIVLNQGNTDSYNNISWTSTTGLLTDTDTSTPTFTPTATGTFEFTMTGKNTATSLIETIYVTVKVETPATVSVDGVSQCINNPITLKAKVSGGTNNSIAWTKNGNTLSETTNEVSDTAPATINETDTYRITVTPTGVCPAVSSEATVTGTSCGVQAIINQQDIDICPGESLQLKALSSTTAHAWSTGESTQSVQVSPTTKTQYVVVSGPSIPSDVIDFLENNVSPVNVSEISDILGYQTEQYYIDIFNVTIKDCGVTTILNRIVCQGETVTVGTQTFSTSGQHSYTLVGGSYLGGDSTVILNLRVIDVAIQAPKTAICMGESLSLGATANPNTEWSATWTTQPSTGLSLSNASDTTTNASGTIAGNYTVTLTASITQSDGIYAITPHTCTATQAIVVHPNPVITDIFTTGRAATILYDQQSGTAPFTFNIGNTVYQHNQLFDLPIGEYRVEIQNAEGCKSFRMFTIVPTPIIPDKFFSPNNDGVNDRWNVVGIEFYPNADIQIFDRFGKQLIRYKGSDLGWDGNYLGNPMPTTDYWYIIYVAEINETLSGHFTLKR